MLAALSMDEQHPNARHRERRRQRRRRQVRRRRAVAIAILLAIAAGITLGARSVGSGSGSAEPEPSKSTGKAGSPEPKAKKRSDHAPLPREIRGVHVTMALASLPGKLQRYLALPGLNTIELDVKDENGRVGFLPAAVPLARRTGADDAYYEPKRVARLVHARGDYLIGRIVTFEDPVRLRPLPERRRPLAHPLSGRAPAADELDDSGLHAVRGQAAARAGGTRLRRRVRPRGDARPRDRAAAAPDLALRGRGLPDGLPVALQRR